MGPHSVTVERAQEMQDFINSLLNPVRRQIFVSYHHANEQAFYAEFSSVFAHLYEVISDNSLARQIESDNPEYVIRRIRESYITGSSCTVVLCGPETPWRKYVDWEIKATLDKAHGLIGVNLPNNPRDAQGKVYTPDRLYDNIVSGYAVWISWADLGGGPDVLRQYVELANSKPRGLCQNERPLRRRNG